MSILNDALDIKLGSTQVDKIYSGTTLVWPWEAFWKFPSPDAGQILRINVETTSDSVTINWGDRTVETVPESIDTQSQNNIEHTYAGNVRYDGFEIVNMSEVRRFWSTGNVINDEPDTSTYRFGGIVDLSKLVNVTSYNMFAQGADIKNFNQLTTSIVDFRHNDGGISEDTSNLNLARLPSLVVFQMQGNSVTGSIHDFTTLPNLVTYNLGRNQLSGTMSDVSQSPNLRTLLIDNNNLTGEIPSLSGMGTNNPGNDTNATFSGNNFTSLAPDFSIHNAFGTLGMALNQISGSLPTFDSTYENIYSLTFERNQFTGEIPSLVDVGSNLASQNVAIFLGFNNYSNVASNFQVNSNLKRLHIQSSGLSQSDVDKIITEVDSVSSYNGFLQLQGNSGNSSATDANIQNLIDRNWSVSV